MKFNRILFERFESQFFKGEVLILYGARRAGETLW